MVAIKVFQFMAGVAVGATIEFTTGILSAAEYTLDLAFQLLDTSDE